MVEKKALVIGGAGFMGSHTADELSRRGYVVTILDVVASPWLRDGQMMNVSSLNEMSELRQAMKGADVVYHFAGVADIADAKQNPCATIDSNVMGVAKVLQVAVECGVKRFVYASTMYVYSAHGSFYRASKQAAEILIDTFQEEFGMDYTLLRFGSLYGPRSQSWNGLKRFVTQIVREGRIEYSGDGREMREYIHVHDAAKLSVDILDQRFANRAITITGQQLISVDKLFAMLFEIAGKELTVSYGRGNGHSDHYGNTPYRYTPKPATKLVPQEFVDLGQGLLDLIEEVHVELDSSGYR